MKNFVILVAFLALPSCGCGKKVVYVYIGGQWLRNSDGQNVVIQAAQIEEQRREEEERMEKQRAPRVRGLHFTLLITREISVRYGKCKV